jgi:peptide/nickel transport system substrate-binding protein
LDPGFARNQFTLWADNMIFNGLTQLNDSLRVIPSIARSWTISPDGKTYTFSLRTDVYFHPSPLFSKPKARKVIASDFIYSFYRLIDPKVASSGSWIFTDKAEGKNSFLAPNDSTFVILLTKPFPPLLKLLTAQYCSVVPHEVVDYYGKDFRNHPIGTGPFRFSYWKEDEILVLLKNENYFETEKGFRLPYLDAIKVSFIRDKQTAFLEFLKKNLDFFNNIDGSYRDDILTKTGRLQDKYKGSFIMVSGPNLDTEYLGMLVDSSKNVVKNSPLKNLKVRQAINYAIDREKIVRYLQNSMGTPGTSGFIPSGMPGFDAKAVQGYTYNPKKTQELLQEAGYNNTHPLPPLSLYTSTTYRDLIEFVQGELEESGIHTQVVVSQASSLREQISKSNIGFFRGSWTADYPDGENYLSVFYSHNKVPFGPNYTGYNNPKFDKLFEASHFETRDSVRFKLYQDMDRLIMADAPVAVLYYANFINLRQNNISGMGINALNLLSLKRTIKR